MKFRNREMNERIRNTMWLLPLLSILLAACERRELTYYSEAEITVTADWSNAGLEEEQDYGSTLIIYPRDGGKPRMVLMGERERTTVRLPQGIYDAVIFNRSFDDFSTLAFRGQDALETLEVYAKETATRAEGRILVKSPDKLASATLLGFEVTEDMLGNYAPAVSRIGNCPEGSCRMNLTPLPLTREVQVKLDVKGLHNVKAAQCMLHEIPLSIFLRDGSYGTQKGKQEFSVGNPVFEEGSLSEGTLEGTINTFGSELPTSPDITLKALLIDGKTVNEQDLTDVKVTEKSDDAGNATLYIEASTPNPFPDVKPEDGKDSGFGADVEEWGDEIVTEIPV